MNLNEIRNSLLDYIMDFQLFELATKRKDMIDEIRNHQKMLNLHLISIYLMNYQDNWVENWKKEIEGWLIDLYMESNNLKKRMLITNKDWYDYLYREPFEDSEEKWVSFLIKRVNIKFKDNKWFKPKNIEEKDFLNISFRFKEFWWKISLNISSKNFETDYLIKLIDDIFIKEKEIDIELIKNIK